MARFASSSLTVVSCSSQHPLGGGGARWRAGTLATRAALLSGGVRAPRHTVDTRARAVGPDTDADAAPSATPRLSRISKSALAGARRGHCYGCGVRLQTSSRTAPGFVEQEQYLIKQRHRQLDRLLCERCHDLNHGKMVPGVQDLALRSDPGEVRLATPEGLRGALAHVREERAVAVLLVDVLDASGYFLSRVRDLVGANPVVLIATKVDLLPTGTNEGAVLDWVVSLAAFKRLRVESAHLVSSKTGQGLSEAIGEVLRMRQGRDVYVLGAANVGKSAFVRAMLAQMASFSSRHFDPAATGVGRYMPTESPMPGTTLGLIALRPFESGGVLFDTPGLHLHHRLPHSLQPHEMRALHPTKRLRPFVAPSPGDVLGDEGAGARRRVPGTGGQAGTRDADGASYWWGGVARVDLVGCPRAKPVFYGPSALRVQASPLRAGDVVAEAGPGTPHEGSFGAESVLARGGLRLAREEVFEGRGGPHASFDVAVSGIPGWVAVHLPPGVASSVTVRVWTCRGVEAFVRPPVPVPSPFAAPA